MAALSLTLFTSFLSITKLLFGSIWKLIYRDLDSNEQPQSKVEPKKHRSAGNMHKRDLRMGHHGVHRARLQWDMFPLQIFLTK